MSLLIGGKTSEISLNHIIIAASADAVLAVAAAAVDGGRRRGAPLHQLLLHHAHRRSHLQQRRGTAAVDHVLLRASHLGAGQLTAPGREIFLIYP